MKLELIATATFGLEAVVKREIEALERRAKAADEARVETEARLAKIAAALRG